MAPCILGRMGALLVVRWLLSTLCIFGVSAQQGGAPVAKERPAVDLGELAVGAVVEASFGVTWDDAALAAAKAEVEPPAGVRVLQVVTGKAGQRAETVVEFAVDTDTTRTIDAAFTVRCGGVTAMQPLRAVVVARPPGGARALVAETPFEADSSDDPMAFAAWRELVAAARLDIDYRLTRRGRANFDVGALSRVDVVLVGERAILALDDQQVAKLQGFVCGGGRVIVFADAFFMGTVAGANRLAEAFDMAIVDREPAAMGWKVERSGLARHPLTVGIDTVEVHRPSPVTIGDSGLAKALVAFTAPSEQPFVAIATTASGGEMVVVGDSLWWNTANKSPGFARLLRNLLQRAPRLR